MSEPSLTTKDVENHGETNCGKQQIKYTWQDYFRFRPVAFAQLLLSQVTGPEGSDQQGQNSGRLITAIRRIVNNNLLATIAFAVIAAAVGYLLYLLGILSAPGITACAAIVTVYWVRMQWVIYSEQCAVMRDQHRAMVRQLKLARRASRQTDEALRLTKMQLRAWVHIDRTKINTFTTGRPIEYTLIFRNSGAVPATITGARTTEFISDPKTPSALTRQNARASGLTTTKIRIPPGRKAKIMPQGTKSLSHEEIINIAADRIGLFIGGVIAYVDDLGNEEAFDWAYTYDHNSHELIGEID